MQHHLSARTVVVMVGILEGRAIEIQEHWLWSLPDRELGSILLTLSGFLRGSGFLDLVTAILLKMEAVPRSNEGRHR